MPGIGSPLGDHFHFRAGRTIEVGGLAGGVYFELLHAILRSRQHSRGATGSSAEFGWSQSSLIGNASRRIASVAFRVYVHAAVHVVAVVAAVERESALVDNRSRNGSIGAHAGLQCNEGADIGAEARP